MGSFWGVSSYDNGPFRNCLTPGLSNLTFGEGSGLGFSPKGTTADNGPGCLLRVVRVVAGSSKTTSGARNFFFQ